MTSKKSAPKGDGKQKKANPNTPGEAAQVAGYTRDPGFGGARGGGTGNSSSGVGTLPAGQEAAEGGRATGSVGTDHPPR
jgi:hypothetical protein